MGCVLSAILWSSLCPICVFRIVCVAWIIVDCSWYSWHAPLQQWGISMTMPVYLAMIFSLLNLSGHYDSSTNNSLKSIIREKKLDSTTASATPLTWINTGNFVSKSRNYIFETILLLENFVSKLRFHIFETVIFPHSGTRHPAWTPSSCPILSISCHPAYIL